VWKRFPLNERNFRKMKKVLFLIGSGSALLLLCILFGAFFADPLFASARSGPTNTAPTPTPTATPDPYCQQYQQDLARRLGVPVSTLQKDTLAASEDVLARLVKDGKLTQDQANRIRSRLESHVACTGRMHGYWGKGMAPQSP
jgi:hypothetical protein